MRIQQRTPRIAVRCARPGPAALRALDELGEPVDLWLHPGYQQLKARLERHSRVRRAFFSPVREPAGSGSAPASSQLPVYGRYDDVRDLPPNERA